MATRKLTAQERKVFGRKVGRLRREGILPANIYGKKIKSLAVQVKQEEFDKCFAEAGETGLVELKVDNTVHPVLIHNLQRDPVTDQPLHADFLEVSLKEKVTATVPVELVGKSPAEKEGGVVVQQMHEVEVEALPTDLPEKVEVDISGLTEIDQAIKAGELKVDKTKVEIKEDPERIVVSVAPPAKEEEAAPPPVAEEAPAEGEQAPTEETAEVPAEGKKEKAQE
ncbi:MAG: 50S ribosomal protein L25 [Candidatus Blackburnbacteria bacterium]|nr:50S ribosomal protein L25 [Candidatus Blackburnbacteria bacterium]